MFGGTLVLVTTTSDIPIGTVGVVVGVSKVTDDDTSSIVAKLCRASSFGAAFLGDVDDFLSSLMLCFLLEVKRSVLLFGRMISRVSETGCQNVRRIVKTNRNQFAKNLAS